MLQNTMAKQAKQESYERFSDLEERIIGTNANKLRKQMLNDLYFILNNFGTPKQYYNFTNPKQSEINKRIDKLQNIRAILLENPETVKEIYKTAVEKFDEREFAKFYLEIRENFLSSYGETRVGAGGQAGFWFTYSSAKNLIRWYILELEKGSSKVTDLVEEFSRKAGMQSESKYTG